MRSFFTVILDTNFYFGIFFSKDILKNVVCIFEPGKTWLLYFHSYSFLFSSSLSSCILRLLKLSVTVIVEILYEEERMAM